MNATSHKTSHAEQAADAAAFVSNHRIYTCGLCMTAWKVLRNAGQHLEAAVKAELADNAPDAAGLTHEDLCYIAAWAIASD